MGSGSIPTLNVTFPFLGTTWPLSSDRPKWVTTDMSVSAEIGSQPKPTPIPTFQLVYVCSIMYLHIYAY